MLCATLHPMTITRMEGSCLPAYRTLSTLALSEPEDHVRELTDWVEHASAVTGVSGAQDVWDTAYKWLRLAQGLRSVTFDMSYDDGGMCSTGLDWRRRLDRDDGGVAAAPAPSRLPARGT